MNKRTTIYLDHNATTPLCPEAREAMLPFIDGLYGNPSSYHHVGRQARSAVEAARRTIAEIFGCSPAEAVFTAGGTEANNLALRGAAAALKDRGRHIITSAIEHHSVLKTAEALGRDGFDITFLPVDAQGVVAPQAAADAIRPDTILISVMHANNETGAVQPVEVIGGAARQRGIAFHTDAVQAFGKIPQGAVFEYADMVTVTAHKAYGPRGAGALLVRRGTPLVPLMTGGHHEQGLRPGTENVAAIGGFAAAAEQAVAKLASESARIAALRDRFEALLLQAISNIAINSRGAPRVPNTSNVCFAGIESESVLLHLDLLGICASAGSACTTGEPEPSHVLRALGLSSVQAQGAVRFSLGRATTVEQIDTVAAALAGIVKKLREVSSL
ncbi:MAG: cysteine desulfurase [Deltaproteobacteria bacterium]|nr:cysteine desulfurase [Deltaproteobacteria bacterium]